MISGLVSTIIPVHNRPQLLREAVSSVLEQRYPSLEIIIVDDGSTDPRMGKSLAECERAGQGKVRVARQPNCGPGAARQRGLELASGQFVQFLDSDDLYFPRRLELLVQALHDQPHAGIAYGKTCRRNSTDVAPKPWKRTGEPLDRLFPHVLGGRIWATSTPLYRTRLVKGAGGWTNLINEEDWELDCRIAARGVRLAWVDEWVAEQRDVAPNRASAGGSSEPAKLSDRATARHSILDSAQSADVPASTPEFQWFIRYSFLVARQCAAAGLSLEAEKLVSRLSKVSPRLAMHLYLAAGRLIGFQGATRIAERSYRILRGGDRRKRR